MSKNMQHTSGSPVGPWVWWWPWPGHLAAPTSVAMSWGWSLTLRSPHPPWLLHSCCSAFGDKGSRHPCHRQGNPPTHPGAPEYHREGQKQTYWLVYRSMHSVPYIVALIVWFFWQRVVASSSEISINTQKNSACLNLHCVKLHTQYWHIVNLKSYYGEHSTISI